MVFIGQPDGLPIGTKNDVWVINASGGEPQCRSAGLDVGVGGSLIPDMPALWAQLSNPNILFDSDDEAALLQVQDGGTIHIYRVALSGDEDWQAVIAGERSCLPMGSDGQQILFIASTLLDPANLYIAALDGSHERQLTEINTAVLAERAMPELEHLDFTGSDGLAVEGWLLKPPGGPAPYPTVLYIHGGPYAAYGNIFFFDYHLLTGAGYAVLFINHRGSSGYGDEFSTAIIGDWGNLDYGDLMAGLDYAIEQGLVDGERLGCTGYPVVAIFRAGLWAITTASRRQCLKIR